MAQERPRPLIVFEMANNHMGSTEHGLRIIRAFGDTVRPFRAWFDFGFKLQYRDLDTFIHPAFQNRMDLKYVKRFNETRLSEDAFRSLKAEMDVQGFIPVCTAFDETSVGRVEEHGFHILKIASCSFGDWPLMERMALSPLPIIASTAGASLEMLDRVVSFFEHRGRPLTILHCIGEYPTPVEHFQLNQVDFLRNRYPNHIIGFSTHEDPGDTRLVQMAVAKGAQAFEKHVGIPLPDAPLNAYSADPEQTRAWLEAAVQAFQACGAPAGRYEPAPEETDSLHALRRGVFVREDMPAGRQLEVADLFLALPTGPDQITANDLGKYVDFTLTAAIPAGSAVLWNQVRRVDNHARVRSIVNRVRQILESSRTVVSSKCDVEISHHYGLDRFEEVGATIMNVVNRAYCKKLIILLPGQLHPEQYHKEKEETFHILHGTLDVTLDGVERQAQVGDVITIERGVRHSFLSKDGCVLEEISSTHFKNDSFYTDPSITANLHRKTLITYFLG
jgi:sialic acid synthase SpsE/mannose-6-phosphate isomerase-like protein (cupin superfamily)